MRTIVEKYHPDDRHAKYLANQGTDGHIYQVWHSMDDSVLVLGYPGEGGQVAYSWVRSPLGGADPAFDLPRQSAY